MMRSICKSTSETRLCPVFLEVLHICNCRFVAPRPIPEPVCKHGRGAQYTCQARRVMSSGFFLSVAERARMQTFPMEIAREELAAYFTLTPTDLDEASKGHLEQNRLGLALTICALRYLGFIPIDLQQHVAADPSLPGSATRLYPRTPRLRSTSKDENGPRSASDPASRVSPPNGRGSA